MKPNSTKKNTLNDYPSELRGPPQNRFGGHKTQRIRGFRENTYGAASECVIYTDEQKQAWLTAHTSIHHV